MNSKANFINNKTVTFRNRKIDTSMPDKTMHERKYEKENFKVKMHEGFGWGL